jgi:PadR family transcriptional regulator, regulatory protein PadR
MREPLPIMKGTLDTLVLKAVSWGPLHGFAITEWIEQRSDGALEVDDSALYQALHRMEDRGYIAGEWGVSESNRRARYYELTAAGRQQLRAESSRLLRYAEALSGLLTASRT